MENQLIATAAMFLVVAIIVTVFVYLGRLLRKFEQMNKDVSKMEQKIMYSEEFTNHD